MTPGSTLKAPLALRGLQVLFAGTMAAGVVLFMVSDQTVLPWVLASVGGPGSALVQWRLLHVQGPQPSEDKTPRGQRPFFDFLVPFRARLRQLGDQQDELGIEFVTAVSMNTMLSDVLAPESGAQRTARARNVPASDGYRVLVKVNGEDVKVTPKSQIGYSWQPVLRARALPRETGSALVGTISWSAPTRFFTVAFPFIGLIFVVVGLAVGLWKLVSGDLSAAVDTLGIVAFGLIFGGGSLLMSLWGAHQARRDQAYLVEWLRAQLPGDDAPSAS